MSEYIVNLDGELGMALAVACAGAGFAREKIVRCRDCREYNTELYQHITCELLGRYVEPDGFCAWGERQEMK